MAYLTGGGKVPSLLTPTLVNFPGTGGRQQLVLCLCLVCREGLVPNKPRTRVTTDGPIQPVMSPY